MFVLFFTSQLTLACIGEEVYLSLDFSPRNNDAYKNVGNGGGTWEMKIPSYNHFEVERIRRRWREDAQDREDRRISYQPQKPKSNKVEHPFKSSERPTDTHTETPLEKQQKDKQMMDNYFQTLFGSHPDYIPGENEAFVKRVLGEKNTVTPRHPNPAELIGRLNNKNPLGDGPFGECVGLVQETIPDMPHTTQWQKGPRVTPTKVPLPGTVIATFKDGKYGKLADGHQHVAVVLRPHLDVNGSVNGVVVVTQGNKVQIAQEHVYYFSEDALTISNAYSYNVVQYQSTRF